MPTHNFDLVPPPESERSRELWLQHAVGFILFEDVRRYAIDRIPDDCEPVVREAIQKGIDDAVYGLMMVIDGVTGALSNDQERVELQITARHVRSSEDSEGDVIASLNLAEGDGMCMGFHGWKEEDYGSDPVARPRSG